MDRSPATIRRSTPALPAMLAARAMLAALLCAAVARAEGEGFRLPSGLLPFQFEMAQRFEPFGRTSKYGVERFGFSGKIRSGSFRYSNSSPAPLSGRQFTAVPAGYSILEGSYKIGKGGLLSGFRSTGHNSRQVASRAAREISGFVADSPARVAGAKLSAYYVKASPAVPPGQLPTPVAPRSSQAGINVDRSFGTRLRLQSEWTRSFRAEQAGGRALPSAGIYVRVSGKAAKTDATLQLRAQGEGLQNPAAPAQGRGRKLDVLEVSRPFGKLRLQYGHQADFYGHSYVLRQPVSGTRRHNLAWTLALVRAPQLTLTRTWLRQAVGDRLAAEETLRLGANKGLKRISVGMAWQEGKRREAVSDTVVWERSGITGDASVTLSGSNRLNLHYEKGTLRTPAVSRVLRSSVLQLNTKLAPWGEGFSLAPALDCRSQHDASGAAGGRAIGVLLAAAIKLPRYVPGADLLVHISSRRSSAAGSPPQAANALQLFWNLKRQ